MSDSVGGIVDRNAFCQDCDGVWTAANAHGVAVQHSQRYGHNVTVEISSAFRYGPQVKAEVNAS